MKDFTWLIGHSFCHRGLHNNKDIPENSLAAFAKAKENGLGLELDVYLTLDGKLIVHHDYSLKRSCGMKVKAPKIDTSRLSDYKLMNTSESVPLFSDVLALVDGAIDLIIEIKTTTRVKAVCEAVWEQLKDYKGRYCIESFNNAIVDWWVKHHPEIIIGQLYDPIWLHTGLLKMKRQYRKVDFLALSVGQINKRYFTKIRKKFKDKLIVAWTVRTPDQLKLSNEHADTIIFECNDKNSSYISLQDAISYIK